MIFVVVDLNQILQPFFWPAIFIILACAIGILLLWWFTSNRETPLSYVRKKSVLDTKTEHELFEILKELYGNLFYIFPQVHYSHLLVPNRELSYKERFALRNRIDRKSADFVLADKTSMETRVVIELDGSSHDLPERQKRDNFINLISNSSNLPLCHIRTEEMDRESVKRKVDEQLAPPPPVSPK
jgi:very-short-patch-repair endonuclease